MKRVQCVAGLILGMFFCTSQLQAAPVASTAVDQVQSETENKLGLSQEQRDKLKSLKEKFRDEQKVISDGLKVKRDALRDELDSLNPDRKKVDVLAADITKLSGQMMLTRIDQVFAIHALLTPEQYQKLRQLLQEKREQAKGNAVADKGKKKGKKK